jgi:hypothetical protein
MFTLRIFLMGLVVLVPKVNNGDWQNLTILLPSAKREECPQAHYAVLICDPNSEGCKECGDGKEIEEKLRLDIPPQGRLLSGLDISITPTPSGKLVPVTGLYRRRWWHSFTGVVPTPKDIEDIHWIPRLAEVTSGAADIERRLLGPGEYISTTEMAARLKLAAGKVKVFSVADVEGQVHSMTFKDSGQPVLRGIKQAVADIIVVELTINNPFVYIYGVELGTKRASSGDLLFKLAPAKGSHEVEVLLGNLTPLQEIVKPEAAAEHFMLYGKLTDPASNLPIPYLGFRDKAVAEVEGNQHLPLVIRAVQKHGDLGVPTVCPLEFGSQGGTNRPICTTIMQEIQ